MGLDQYIFKEIENEYEEDGRTKVEEIYSFRKNYQLNDWACWNWCPDGMADFNCERLPLYDFMVEELLTYIINNLDKSDSDEDGFPGIISEDILEVLKDCKKRITKGEVLYYYAWW